MMLLGRQPLFFFNFILFFIQIYEIVHLQTELLSRKPILHEGDKYPNL